MAQTQKFVPPMIVTAEQTKPAAQSPPHVGNAGSSWPLHGVEPETHSHDGSAPGTTGVILQTSPVGQLPPHWLFDPRPHAVAGVDVAVGTGVAVSVAVGVAAGVGVGVAAPGFKSDGTQNSRRPNTKSVVVSN